MHLSQMSFWQGSIGTAGSWQQAVGSDNRRGDAETRRHGDTAKDSV
jgi:hypothetical protein